MNVENFPDGNTHSQNELQQLRDFYEQGPDIFVTINVHKHIIQSCNRTAVRKLCYVDKSQLIGQHFLILYHPDDHDNILALFEKFCLEGKIANEKVLLRRQDGVAIPALLRSTAVRNDEGVIIRSRSVLRDVPKSNNQGDGSADTILNNKKLLDEFSSIKALLDCLVGDERSVFDGIVGGQLNKQIARKLDLSERTIERLRSRLVNKLNTKSTANLIAMASRFEILQRLFSDLEDFD